MGKLLVFVGFILRAQEVTLPLKNAGEPISEIVVKNNDGSFTLKEVQLIGRGVPKFKAKILNGMAHDWDFPVFSVVYEGYDLQDPTRQIRQSFTIKGMCRWPKRRVCEVFKELDFPLFVVERYKFELTGGTRILTDAEKAAEAELRRIELQEQSKKDAAAAELREELARKEEATIVAEQKRLRMACAVIYRKTANKKIGDLTVKEEQQIRACQVLGLYPPR